MTSIRDHHYDVCVFIGDEGYHVKVKDHDTCGLLLSECMRSFMAKHNDEDPGLLGLKILDDGRDLDLGADVIDSIKIGETVVGVSYTVSQKKTSVDRSSVHTLRGARKHGTKRVAPPKKSSFRWLVGNNIGDLLLGSEKEEISNLTRDTREADTATTLGQSSRSTHQNAVYGKPAMLATDDIKQGTTPQRSIFGKQIHHVFTPLTHLAKDVKLDNEKKKLMVKMGRAGFGQLASADLKKYKLKVHKDPSGDLPLFLLMLLGPTRCSLMEEEAHDFIFDWKYQEINSWGDTGRHFFVQVFVPKGTPNSFVVEEGMRTKIMWRFEFEVVGKKPTEILSALYARCTQIVKLKKRKDSAQQHLNGLLPKSHCDDHLHSFRVLRLADPSGILPQRLLFYVGHQRVVIADDATHDPIFDWPFTMIYAWRVDYGEVTLSIIENSKQIEYGFKTSKSWYIKYALEKAINDILRHNNEKELAVGDDIPKAELASITFAYREDQKRRSEAADEEAEDLAMAEAEAAAKEEEVAAAAAKSNTTTGAAGAGGDAAAPTAPSDLLGDLSVSETPEEADASSDFVVPTMPPRPEKAKEDNLLIDLDWC